MTPKSLLRHKRAVSTLADMSGESSFHRVLWDDAQLLPEPGRSSWSRIEDPPRRALLGQGLLRPLEEREKRGIDDVYLLRVEQLYPFPAKSLITELSRFRNAEMVWCQEEPKNMGAWSFVDPYLEWVLAHIDAKHQRVRYAGRPAAASPATGLMSKHLAQLAGLPRRRARRIAACPETRHDETTEHEPTWLPTSAFRPSANPSPRRRSASGSRRPATRSSRRAPGRARDRQGHPRGAGARRRHAVGDRRQGRRDRRRSARCSARSAKAARKPPPRPRPRSAEPKADGQAGRRRAGRRRRRRRHGQGSRRPRPADDRRRCGPIERAQDAAGARPPPSCLPRANISADQVPGSGKRGQVLKGDVLDAIAKGAPSQPGRDAERRRPPRRAPSRRGGCSARRARAHDRSCARPSRAG